MFGKQRGWGGVTAISGWFRGVGGCRKEKAGGHGQGEDSHQREGALGLVELLLTEVPPNPCPASPSPKSPIYASLGSCTCTEGTRFRDRSGGLVGTAVCASGCNLCSVHVVFQAVSHLCLEPSVAPRSLWAKAKVLAVAPPKGLDGLPVPSLTSSPPASLLAYSTAAHPPASRSLMCQTHSNFSTFAPAGPSAWTSLPSIAPELPLSPLSRFDSNVAFSEGPPLTVLFKIEAP